MNRRFDWQAAIGNGRRESYARYCVSVAICCLFGLAAVSQVRAIQEGGRLESAQPGVSAKTSPATGTEKTKIAEGEYVINQEANNGAVGPPGEEVYDFHESWTLWRNVKGQYEVEGERKFESPRDEKHANRFLVQLTRDLTPIRMTEFAKLVWRRDSGPLTCEFLHKEIHCSSGARNTEQAIDLRIPMEFPYGLLWPISPFSLSGLTRQAEREVNHPTPIQLLSVEQPSADNPVSPVVRNGQLQYAGTENIEVADRNWRAYKFVLKVPSYPAISFWTSSKGLLLSVTIEHTDPNWPLESMKLVRFREWTNFSGQVGL
jgi:hypothetical protein